MRRTRKKSISILVALTFVLTLLVPMGAALAQDDVAAYPRGFSSGYDWVLSGKENQQGGYAAIRLPEDADVPRVADELVVSVTLPDGVQYMKKATQDTLEEYVSVVEGTYEVDVTLVSSSRSSLEIAITPEEPTEALDLAVVFDFYGPDEDTPDDSCLEVDGDVTGNINATVEFIGFRNGKNVFSDSEDLLIAKVSGEDVTISAATPKTVAVGSNREAAKITVAEGTAGALAGGTIELEVVTDGAEFSSDTTLDGIRYDDDALTFEIVSEDDDTEAVVEGIYQTVDLPGKIEITPYLDVTPDASGDIEIQVTVLNAAGDELASDTVTVAKAAEAVAFTVTDVKNTGGSIVAGHTAATLEEDNEAAEFTIEVAGASEFPDDAVVYVELTGAKFDDPGFDTDAGVDVNLYNDDKAAWFELPEGEDEITLSNFVVKANADAAEGDIVVKLKSNVGSFEPAEVVIGKVVKPFTVEASSAPQIAYLGQAQAAGDIVIKETKKGAILADPAAIRLELPEGVAFAAKPTVKVTEGNLDLGTAKLEDDDAALLIPINDVSTRPSTITISGIKYDVNRLALDGDVEVEVVGVDGDPDDEDDAPGTWTDKTIASVVNAKVVSAAKREASFVIGSTTYTVNGEEKTMDVAPYIDAATGRTYLPVRYVGYALGVAEENIFWDAQARAVTLLKGDRVVQMTIGSKALLINGITLTMDAAPVIKDGRTMLPFRWVAQALGASVSWDEATKTVTMNLE